MLVKLTPEQQNGPILSSTSEEIVTGTIPVVKTGSGFTHLNQSGETSSYLSEKNLKETMKEDRPHLSGKHKSNRQEKSKSGENFFTQKNV